MSGTFPTARPRPTALSSAHQGAVDAVRQWIDPRSSVLDDLFADMLPPHAFLETRKQALDAEIPLLDAILARPDAPVEAMVRRLVRRCQLAVFHDETLDAGLEALTATEASMALQTGIVRLKDGRFVVAVRGKAVERALPMLRRHQGTLAETFFFTSPRAFADLVMQLGGTALAQHAENCMVQNSGAVTARSTGFIRCVAVGLVALVAYSLWQGHFPVMVSILGSVFFVLLALMRFYACSTAWQHNSAALEPRIPDHALPIYTVLIPLFKEARIVEKLVHSVCTLDYPAAKLDIKFLVEDTDSATQDALANAALRGNMEVLTVAAFQRGDERLACVQGHLTIDNTHDGWLTQYFTLEYAALFTMLLPAFARLKVLFPLGGTSNHFTAAALRTCGGWDAYNVTEDADLGVRLGRAGYTLGMIESATWEEAPNRLKSWIMQRTRWMKGYMVTWGVHMCTPRVLLREIGWKNFLVFQGFIGGVPLVALAFPVFMVHCAVQGWAAWQAQDIHASVSIQDNIELGVIIGGFLAAFLLVTTALIQRRLWSLWAAPFTLIFYWLLIAFAAWRALFQLLYAPHFWEKTEHGLARTSRMQTLKAAIKPTVKNLK